MTHGLTDHVRWMRAAVVAPLSRWRAAGGSAALPRIHFVGADGRGRDMDMRSAANSFDAARDLDLHVASLEHTNETAVGGRTSGLIELGEEVTWRARHFGIYQHFTSKITAFEPPHYFQDSMQRGAFESFVHDHFFLPDGDGTQMKDVLVFVAPLGVLGRIAEKLVLHRYLERLINARAVVIKNAAELVRGTA